LTTTTTTSVAPTTTLPEVTPLLAPLVAVGRSDGPETARIQERLLELGFWLQLVDGDFGGTTKQAVMAFQKYMGLEATARVDQVTADALTLATTRAVGLSNEPGTLVEVDKDKQVLFIMNSGKLLWAINISTGSGQYYLETNQKDLVTWETGRSLTPSGRYKIDREKPDGWWDGDLGQIYRPKYFKGGIAIHGSMSIPNYPASHGCVRVSTAAMDMIWASGLLPKKTPVWVYGNDVEAEGEPPVIPTTTTTTTTTLPVDPNLTTTIAPV
jgi:peptidoglycan hydrolase-like protein with peptidoglycan-binding domain